MKKFLLSFLLCFTFFVFADADLESAQQLADEDIINSPSSSSVGEEAFFRLNDPILRQEVLGIALKLRGTDISNVYQCKGYFVDIDELWVCRAAELAADYNIITRANLHFRPKDTLTLAEAIGITLNTLRIPLSDTSILSISGRLPDWQKRLILTIKEQQIPLDIRDAYGRGIVLYDPEIGIRVLDFDMSHRMTRGEFFQLVTALRDPNQSASCYDYRYSDCPSYCEKKCIPSSCSGSLCNADGVCGGGLCSLDCEGYGSCIPKQNTTPTCYDSDGLDYFTKGTTIGSDPNRGNETTTAGDGCFDTNTVTEYYCDNENYPYVQTSFYCKYGCSNGACRRSYGEDIYDNCLTYSDGCNDCSITSGSPVCTERYCFWQGIPKCYTCKSGSHIENDRCVVDTVSCKKEGEAVSNSSLPPEYQYHYTCCSGLTEVGPKEQYITGAPNICVKIGDGYCDSRYESTVNSSDCRTSSTLDTSICQSYYDGCNTCSRSSNGQEICTMMYCIAIFKPAYCTSYISYTPYSQSQDSAFLTKVSTEIKNYVSDLSCTDSSQCRDSYFGDGQCYGDMFIMYSTKNIDQTLLTEKTTYYTNAKKRFNETYTPGYKLPSIQCPLLSPPPPLICHDNICQRDDIMAYKPVIYLYPESTTDVHVKLDFQGKLVVTYPTYDSVNGWSVMAQPDGTLTDKKDGREYSYLFWEGAYDDIRWNLSQGFVVKGEDTVKFLQEKLAYLGLTPKEYNEFIVYWYPLMKDNAYNFITFAGKEYTDSARLTITPTPDSILRVFMVYKPLTGPISIPEQTLTPFIRTGFSVIEWGGTEVK